MSLTRQAFALVKLNKCGARLGLELFVFLRGLEIPAPGIKVQVCVQYGKGQLAPLRTQGTLFRPHRSWLASRSSLVIRSTASSMSSVFLAPVKTILPEPKRSATTLDLSSL